MPISFSTKRDPTAGLLPVGVYKFVIEKATDKPGNKFPLVLLDIRPIVNGVKWKSLVWDNLSTSPDARFRVDQLLNSLGVPNEDGNVGSSWFVGKVGWARFQHEIGDDEIVRAKIKEYVTEARAEKLIEQAVERGASDEDTMVVRSQRSSRPAPDPEAKPKSKSKTAAAIAEHGSDEDIPF